MVRSGRGFDGERGQDFAEFLRRELHAAADQVEPGADGLERIRDKIRSRPARASRPRGARGVWLAISGFLAGLGRRVTSVRPGPERDGATRGRQRAGGHRSGPGTGARRCCGRPSRSARPCSPSAWSWPSYRPRARSWCRWATTSARPSTSIPAPRAARVPRKARAILRCPPRPRVRSRAFPASFRPRRVPAHRRPRISP